MKEISATRRRTGPAEAVLERGEIREVDIVVLSQVGAAAARRHGDVEPRVALLEEPEIGLVHIPVRLCDPHLYSLSLNGIDDGGVHSPHWADEATQTGGSDEHVFWPPQR